MKLQWISGRDRYYIQTECGRYTVCKHYTGETCTYAAWRTAGEMGTPIAHRVEDSITARRLCQDYEDAISVATGRGEEILGE